MVILKFALLTSVFYLGIAFALQAVLIALAYMNRIIMVHINRLGFGILFGAIWLVSFAIAWHMFYSGLNSRLPVPPN